MNKTNTISTIAKDIFLQKSNFVCNKTLERKSVQLFLQDALELIFPGMLHKFFQDQEALELSFKKNLSDLTKFLNILHEEKSEIDLTIQAYLNSFPYFCDVTLKDATFLFQGDPAATSIEEVLLCYPGLYAVATYRIAHFFYQHKNRTLARLMCEIAHEKTGIDIHPGAKIGESFFIDHGTGVVIGETAVIGNHVKIYQGVTLGAVSVDKELAAIKRHPTIEDGCVIYSHATILGGDTVIGKESVIGGNVWMTKSVPSHSLVFHKSEVKLDQKKNINQQLYNQEDLNYEI
jgi:serine O-acetyltransferase